MREATAPQTALEQLDYLLLRWKLCKGHAVDLTLRPTQINGFPNLVFIRILLDCRYERFPVVGSGSDVIPGRLFEAGKRGCQQDEFRNQRQSPHRSRGLPWRHSQSKAPLGKND